MPLAGDPAVAAQQQYIADVKTAIRREEAKLARTPAYAPTLSHSPPAREGSSSTSSSHSNGAEAAPSEQPFMWTRVQQRMRTLHALDAKCAVEEAAVRRLEEEVRGDMEASLGRKSALMSRLQHLCHDEALLKSAEALLGERVAALAKAEQKTDVARAASEQQLQDAVEHNRRRRQQLESAVGNFTQRQAFRERERKQLRADIAALDTRTDEIEREVQTTVQRISDQERTSRLEEANTRSSEQSRIEVLKSEIGRLGAELEAGEL